MYLPPPGNEHHDQDPRSQKIELSIADGLYVYVRDLQGDVWVLPDESAHQHVKILGGTTPVLYAGDLEVSRGVIISVTNCSGTFSPDSSDGLLEVARQLQAKGFEIREGGIVFLSWTRRERLVLDIPAKS